MHTRFVGKIRISWPIVILYVHLLSWVHSTSIAPRTSEPSTNTHIISFVAQRKTNAKYAEINDFDFESFDDTSDNKKYFSMNGAIEQLFGRLLAPPRPIQGTQKSAKLQSTDDLFNSSENTLESTDNLLSKDTPHESFKNFSNASSNAHHRFKQSIPVLEPVRHLLNTVRDGNFNHTKHFNNSRHHLVSPGKDAGTGGGEESSAIETMADREMVENSVSFNVIDFLGRIGGKIWGFLMNLFAASSSNASAASSFGGSV